MNLEESGVKSRHWKKERFWLLPNGHKWFQLLINWTHSHHLENIAILQKATYLRVKI